ncbi:Spo0E family sporulation regulatory protein-aspartic acid phosphatase [Bacillus lacus]|uniref:Spo0E family sporulation regulatory protein-aspartic acid phosphatase n=1 Tax=Metabacillus lacus TaxID=1983721 RepID=A0A7X2J1F7_9BACI|nr:aspartyl-phosphate phosphatase Spo0E family protein [Metabacillus lacus]MRX73514.1 Spo0E family sporulation regulatory protein-aspartic acid phosphatase [Metabacillus lacus]
MARKDIEIQRKNMIDTARKYGMNATETIRCSQELDHLLNQELKMNTAPSQDDTLQTN